MASTRERNGRFTGLYRDSAGKQKSAGTFDDEKEALDAAEHEEALANPPKYEEFYPRERRGKVTVACYARTWLDNQVLEETIRETYRRTADRIVRHLGSMTRGDVNPNGVRKMLKALKKSGLSDSTVSAKLDLARGILGKQACADVKFRIKDRRERMPVTPKQAEAIEAAIHPIHKLLVRTAFATAAAGAS